jgi:hypothetical protein
MRDYTIIIAIGVAVAGLAWYLANPLGHLFLIIFWAVSLANFGK